MVVKVKIILVHYLTVNKTTVLFEAGTYGQFLLKLLNLTEISITEHFEFPYITYTNTTPKRSDHHLIEEKEIKGHVTKITFDNLDADLINRNKWTKLPEHLEEQANKTFYNDKNAKLFTIACNKINLLSPNNIFKKVASTNTLEVKFKSFHFDIPNFIYYFIDIFSKLNIPITKDYLERSKKNFDISQNNIIEANNKKNDLIHDGNILGQMYFDTFGNNIQTENFQKLIKGG